LYVYDRAVVLVPLRSAAALAVGVGAVVALGIALPSGVWSPIIGKLSLSDLSSGSARLAGWTQGVSVALEHPVLGTGIGSTSRETGSGLISFYLTMLREGGVVTLGTVVLFLGAMLHRIGALPSTSRYKYAYAASFIAAVCHYAVISDVWYPWLWLLCALIACDARQASNHRATLG
jgi:O-antigen ligase